MAIIDPPSESSGNALANEVWQARKNHLQKAKILVINKRRLFSFGGMNWIILGTKEGVLIIPLI